MILTLTLDNYQNATLDVKLVDGIQLVMRGPRGGSSRSIVLTPAAARTVAIQLLALAEEIKPEADYATGAEIDEARRLYGRDGEVEIDEDAKASRGDDDGCYIAAWVWLPAGGRDVDDADCERGGCC